MTGTTDAVGGGCEHSDAAGAGQTNAAGAGGIHERWIVFVTAQDRSGTLTALAETFSSRGVSFESFTTLSVGEGVGEMSITFRGSERLARVLARTLDRLAMTRAVTLAHAADPALRAVAVVDGQVLTGALTEVEERIRAAGRPVEALTVLPPATPLHLP